jgi:hypothetical protein
MEEFINAHMSADTGDDSHSDKDELGETAAFEAEDSAHIDGVLAIQIACIKDRIAAEMDADKPRRWPKCYRNDTFWEQARDSFFALRNQSKTADRLNPTVLYACDVFVWLPHLLSDVPLKCPSCNGPLTIKGRFSLHLF